MRLRQIHHLTQRQAAAKIGVCSATLNRIENEKIDDVSWSVIDAICRTFEVGPDYLLGFDRFWPAVGQCLKCGGKVAGDPHTPPMCIMSMHRQGRSLAYIAREFDFTVRTIQFIVREEFAAAQV